MSLRDVVLQNRNSLAFVVGNGINRYKSSESGNSWRELLSALWAKYIDSTGLRVPTGISLTEFYDVLEIRNNENQTGIKLQSEFADLMEDWKPLEHHVAFVEWAKRNSCPVLTTNFENTLGSSIDCNLYHMRRDGFTDFYPWESYYACEPLNRPGDGFGIWHINGMQQYPRSIRLGLTHYMGSVSRAREWIHKNKDEKLYSGKNHPNWRGKDSWVHILFNLPIAIFGLGLGTEEVFLRWLLIERAKYFARFPDRRKSGWYFYTEEEPDAGKILFFESIGIMSVRVSSYAELYERPWRGI